VGLKPFTVEILDKNRIQVGLINVPNVNPNERPIIINASNCGGGGSCAGQYVRIERNVASADLILGQVQVFGGKVGTIVPTGVEHSKASITSTASINGGPKHAPTSPDEPVMIRVPITISSTEATVPILEAGIYLKKVVGAGMVDVSMNRIFKTPTLTSTLQSTLQRAITANQLNPEIIALDFASTTGAGDEINVFSANSMSEVTLQPAPDNRFFLGLTNYLKDSSVLTSDDYATYRMIIVIYEKAAHGVTGKPVGTVTYEFNLLNPSGL